MKTSTLLIVAAVVLGGIYMLTRRKTVITAPAALPVAGPAPQWPYGGQAGGQQYIPTGGMTGDQQLAGSIVGGILQAGSSIVGSLAGAGVFSSGDIGGGDWSGG